MKKRRKVEVEFEVKGIIITFFFFGNENCGCCIKISDSKCLVGAILWHN